MSVSFFPCHFVPLSLFLLYPSLSLFPPPPSFLLFSFSYLLMDLDLIFVFWNYEMGGKGRKGREVGGTKRWDRRKKTGKKKFGKTKREK